MSVAVPLDELADEVDRRTFAYLLTVDDAGRPKAVALVPTVVDGALRFDAGGGRTCANAGARPDVSVVFPPGDADEFSLVVDGTATVSDDIVTVSPTWAVRHRPAPT